MKCWSVHAIGIGRVRALLVAAALSAALPAMALEAEAAAPAAKATKPAPPAKPRPKFQESAECVRTGQRVIAALARDDSGAATQFHSFYTAFKCPPQHLAQAFGCLVALQTQHPNISNPSPEQVTQCWDDPATIPTVKPAPPAPPKAD